MRYRKEEFRLVPTETKKLRFSTGTEAPQNAKVQAESTDNQTFTIPGSYFMRMHSHYHGYTARIIAFSLSAFRDNTCVE